MCRFAKTSTAFLKGKACSTGFLDKTIWNPRPVIDLLSRAVFESGVSFLHFLGPTFSALLTVSALLTGAVGIYFLYNQNTWPLQSVMGAGHYTVEYFKYQRKELQRTMHPIRASHLNKNRSTCKADVSSHLGCSRLSQCCFLTCKPLACPRSMQVCKYSSQKSTEQPKGKDLHRTLHPIRAHQT